MTRHTSAGLNPASGQQTLAAALANLKHHPTANPDLAALDLHVLPAVVLESVALELNEQARDGVISHQPGHAELKDLIGAALFADWDLLMIVEQIRRSRDQLELSLPMPGA